MRTGRGTKCNGYTIVVRDGRGRESGEGTKRGVDMNDTDIDKVRLARFIAEKAFKDKKDLGGNPYMGHINRVTNRLSIHLYDETYTITALLHDLVEDCEGWNFEILEQLFGPKVTEALVLLTRSKDEDYMSYIHRIKENTMASDVKMADLEDNMDVSRLNKLDDKDVERIRKYMEAYRILKG